MMGVWFWEARGQFELEREESCLGRSEARNVAMYDTLEHLFVLFLVQFASFARFSFNVIGIFFPSNRSQTLFYNTCMTSSPPNNVVAGLAIWYHMTFPFFISKLFLATEKCGISEVVMQQLN